MPRILTWKQQNEEWAFQYEILTYTQKSLKSRINKALK